jgi:hypothetical protein
VVATEPATSLLLALGSPGLVGLGLQPVLVGAAVGAANGRLRPWTLLSLAVLMGGAVIALQSLVALPDNVARGCLLPPSRTYLPTTDWCFDQTLQLVIAPYAVAGLALVGLAGGIAVRRRWRRNSGEVSPATPVEGEWQPAPAVLLIAAILALVPWGVGAAAQLVDLARGSAFTFSAPR